MVLLFFSFWPSVNLNLIKLSYHYKKVENQPTIQSSLIFVAQLSCRFPSAVKPSKSHKNNATSVRGSLTSSKQSPLLLDSPDSDEPQPGTDVVYADSASKFAFFHKLSKQNVL